MTGPGDETVTPEAAKQSFLEHVRDKAMTARMAHGLYVDTNAVLEMLDDRGIVRYPTTIVFDAGPLRPNEFAFPQPVGFHAGDGYALCLHPCFRDQREIWSLLIAYHLPVINYGDIADAEVAEVFGATLHGLEVESYYQALCELADSMPSE